MAERPVFLPAPDEPGFVRVVKLALAWSPGFAVTQKKKNILSLHNAAARAGFSPILEVSTKSDEALGRRLSAFHLRVKSDQAGDIPLECAFQGSKVFEFGGPYTDLYVAADPRQAKRDPRLRESGPIVAFEFNGYRFPTAPKTLFYDWLYINAIFRHRAWLQSQARFMRYAGFTDIEFNPAKSINCQARACALFAALIHVDLLSDAVESPHAFLRVLTRSNELDQDIPEPGLPFLDHTSGADIRVPDSPLSSYLLSSERAQLELLGVTARNTSLTFTRGLDEAQFRRVWHIVAAIQRRRPQSEDWVNWLIGDFGNEVEARLGKGSFEHIIQEETGAYRASQHLLRTSGATLLALQIAERAIAVCCRLLDANRSDNGLTFSWDTAATKRTLGQLNREIQARGLFVPDFEQRMNGFVKRRNEFTHQLLADSINLPLRKHRERMDGFQKLESSILGLLRDSAEVTAVFFGLITAIGVNVAEQANVASIETFLDEHGSPDWRENLRNFVAVHHRS